MSKPDLHQSQVSMLLMCAKDYELTYVQGLRMPPVVRMLEGTAVHRAGEKNLTSKIESGILLPESDVLDIARDSLNEEWDKEGVALSSDEKRAGESMTKGRAADAAVRMARYEHRTLAPALDVVHVERPFRIAHPSLEFNISGTVDTQTQTAIRDRKTARITPPPSRAHNSLQLTLYHLGIKTIDGEAPAEIWQDTIVDLKTGPRISSVETVRTKEDYAQAIELMNVSYGAIRKGVFLPAHPDSWRCSKEYCRHWENNCPFGRRNRKRMDG